MKRRGFVSSHYKGEGEDPLCLTQCDTLAKNVKEKKNNNVLVVKGKVVRIVSSLRPKGGKGRETEGGGRGR